MSHLIVAIVPDLFFLTKIEATARAAGVEFRSIAAHAALERCAELQPARILLDLHAGGDLPALIRALKADERTRRIPLLGFFSHVQMDVRNAALGAGLDVAWPRSVFVARLPEIVAMPPESEASTETS